MSKSEGTLTSGKSLSASGETVTLLDGGSLMGQS